MKRKISIVLILSFILTQFSFIAHGEIVSQPLYGHTMPEFFPPKNEHPRVMFLSSDIEKIKNNMKYTQNEKAESLFFTHAFKEYDGVLSETLTNGTNRYIKGLSYIQAKAFYYAIYSVEDKYKEKASIYGEEAIEAINNYIDTYVFPAPTETTTANYYYPSHLVYVTACVYDWCYPLLDKEEKEQLVSKVIDKIASKLNFGWPLSDNINPLNGYGNLTMLMRDMLSFSIAVYDEYPDIYNYVASILTNEFKEIRDFWYTSHTENQGTRYGPLRLYSSLFMQWLFKTISGKDVLNTNVYQVPYQFVYYLLPDKNLLREGDHAFVKIGSTEKENPRAILGSLLLASSLNSDSSLKGVYEYLAEEYSDTPATDYSYFSYDYLSLTPVEFLIINNPSLEVSELSCLPKTRYFGSPNGTMVARTGWNDEKKGSDVVAYMRISENYYASHQHFDAGTFQIYYKGALAPNQTHYNRTDNEHYSAYNIQTIAHNSLLIYDPSEIFTERNDDSTEIVNSGGQRKQYTDIVSSLANWKEGDYNTGKVLKQGYGPDKNSPAYSFIDGDITNAYSDKVSEVRRAMMFMPTENEKRPAVMFVMDKIVSKDKTFKKTFLLHSMEEPIVAGNTTILKRTTDGFSGKLVMQTLYPKNPVIEKIGGVGKQWYIDGKNYVSPGVKEDDMSFGWGRVEVSPSDTARQNYFLNVLYVGDTFDADPVSEAVVVEKGNLLGAQVLGKVALFNKTSTPIDGVASFRIKSDADIAVSGLKEGVWEIYRGETFIESKTVDEESGTLYIENASSGTYTIKKRLNADDYVFVNLDTFSEREFTPFYINDVLIDTPYGVVLGTAVNEHLGYERIEYGMIISKDKDKILNENNLRKTKFGITFAKGESISPKDKFGILFYGKGILPGVTYYVRTYAVYNNGTGDIITFGDDITSFTP